MDWVDFFVFFDELQILIWREKYTDLNEHIKEK
jgi:hypothetical protein